MAASRRGLDVALVEKGPLGGTCLTRGCDPSKTLLHRADIVEQIRRSSEFGIDTDVRDANFERIIDESNRPWDEKARRIEENLRDLDGFTLYKAEGQFVDDRGFVETNEYLETSAENVWAFGDAIGGPQFRHTANHESQVVFRNAVRDRRDAVDYTGNSHAIFSAPEVASLGQTEQELEANDRDYATGRKEFTEVAMGTALKDEDGFVKVLADPDDGEILGCHVLGSDASTLIHEVAVAMTAGDGTVADVEDTIHIHPALSEVVEGAFENVSE
ncbi:FAD-dependent oxidoreductase [Halorussus aquaticus]|uniref:FAD-dependent oxidoreductase n=1 Tax=Halorussus aquaticus TaxID=2953748 RepID=A0ABD5Q823_9EURY